MSWATADEADRELDWLLSKDENSLGHSQRLESPEDELPPRPAMGDFYAQDDDDEVDEFNLYNFKETDPDDEKLRAVGYDPEELERQGNKQEILQSIINAKQHCDENKMLPYVDVRERVRELNAQIAKDETDKEAQQERQRTIQFKEKLVEMEIPADTYDNDADEATADDTKQSETHGLKETQTTQETEGKRDLEISTEETNAQYFPEGSDAVVSSSWNFQEEKKSANGLQKDGDEDGWKSDSSEELNDGLQLMQKIEKDRLQRFRKEFLEAPRSDPFAVENYFSAPMVEKVEDDDDRYNASVEPQAVEGKQHKEEGSSESIDKSFKSSDDSLQLDRHEESSDIAATETNENARKDKVLIECDGQFELVNPDDVRARDLGLPCLLPEHEENNPLENEDSERTQPHPPAEPRPFSANESRKSTSPATKPKRSWSARPANDRMWNKDDLNYASPYGLSDREKKLLMQQKKRSEDRERQKKTRRSKKARRVNERERRGIFILVKRKA